MRESLKRQNNGQPDGSLPHNLEAERAVLGAILLDNAAFAVAQHDVEPSSFFLTQNRHVFSAMKRLADKHQPIDTISLAEELGTDDGGLEAAGGVAYLSALPDGLPRANNVPHYARIVHEKATLRGVMYTANALMTSAAEPGADIPAIEKQLAGLQTSLAARTKSNGNGNGYHRYSTADFLVREFEPPEHLVEGIIPRSGSAMIVAMPHHLKSWFTLGLAYGSTRAGVAMGQLEIKKPVRTLLFPIEDFPGQVQWRMRQLLSTPAYKDIDLSMVDVIPRPKGGGFDIMDEHCFQYILRQIQEFRADHAVFDVLRRMFRGDINSPKDSAALCEQFDRLRDETGVATTIVHHENRKEADLMRASAGSFNIPAWANSVIQFKRKFQESSISHVEIEVDNKLAQSPDPVRMILNLEADTPLKLEPLEDIAGVQELREKLGVDWTYRDMADVLDVHKTSAIRRIKKMLVAGVIEKVSSGRRGRIGGLARYCFMQDASTPE